MKFDLMMLADRLRAGADKSGGVIVEVTATDVVLSKNGHGTGRSESFPFAALFLRSDDVLGQALDRLEATSV